SGSGSHEPVAHAPRIVVESRNCPHWIVGVRVSTLVKPRTSAWSVEGGDHAVSGSHESVWRASAEFMVEPRDLTLRVDARGFGVKRLARRVRDAKAGDRAIWCSQEPMPMVIIPADVVPRDRALRIVGRRKGTFPKKGRMGKCSVKGRDRAVWSAQESVGYVIPIDEVTCDGALIDALRESALVRARTGTCSVEGGEGDRMNRGRTEQEA